MERRNKEWKKDKEKKAWKRERWKDSLSQPLTLLVLYILLLYLVVKVLDPCLLKAPLPTAIGQMHPTLHYNIANDPFSLNPKATFRFISLISLPHLTLLDIFFMEFTLP